MSNELLLILSMAIYFGGYLLTYYLFGKLGLVIWNCLALIIANIEVTILINAFGIVMTLGNVCFTSTSLVTDLSSEKYGAQATKRLVWTGFYTTLIFMLVSQFWLLHQPTGDSNQLDAFHQVFAATPRVIFAGLAVYIITQLFDIKIFFFLWSLTKKIDPDATKFLWIRNNGSTIISQLLNAILFNLIAFYGVFTNDQLGQVIVTTFLISVFGSIISTPFIYLARAMKPKNLMGELK